MLIVSVSVFSQSKSDWSFKKPYTGKYPFGINTFDLGVSYLNTNYSSPIVLSFGITFLNCYFSYGSNYGSSPENVYGEGYLTDKELLESFKVGYCITTNKWLYVIPFVGLVSKSQLYSDMEYGHIKLGSSSSYYNTGIIICSSFKKIDIKYTCGIREQGISVGLNLHQFVDIK